jgi:hypothetical protein
VTGPAPQAIAAVVRPLILERFRPDSCIASTVAVVQVSRYFGQYARTQPVRMCAWNAEAAGLMQAGVLMTEWPGSAWSVGVTGTDQVDPNGVWDGHLVAVTATHLIDASLDQFSRPSKGITLTPSAFELSPEWAPDGVIAGRMDGGVVLCYERITATGHRVSSNLSVKHPDIRYVVGSAIRQLRELAA